MDLNIGEVIGQARDTLTARRVFGEPVRQNGVTVIPAAAVRGGAGGGGGRDQSEAEGGGVGYGVMARPVGAFVIRGDDVEWRPATDSGRLAMARLVVAALAILTVRTAVKLRAKERAKRRPIG